MSDHSSSLNKSNLDKDIQIEADISISDFEYNSKQEELISKELVALLNSSLMEGSCDGASSGKSNSSIKMNQSENLGKNRKYPDDSKAMRKEAFAGVTDDRRHSFNVDFVNDFKKRSSLFQPSQKEDFFVVENGKPGWKCSNCGNFNYCQI